MFFHHGAQHNGPGLSSLAIPSGRGGFPGAAPQGSPLFRSVEETREDEGVQGGDQAFGKLWMLLS